MNKKSRLTRLSNFIDEKLNSIDTYGKPIHLNFNGSDEYITTAFGGFASLIGLLAMGFYVVL